MRDVGHSISTSMDFAWVCGLWDGRKQEGRPMVWETRKVRKEMNHSQFISIYTLPLLPTNLKNAPGYPLPTSITHETCHTHRHQHFNTHAGTCYLTPPTHSHACQHSDSQWREFGWHVLWRGDWCHITSFPEPMPELCSPVQHKDERPHKAETCLLDLPREEQWDGVDYLQTHRGESQRCCDDFLPSFTLASLHGHVNWHTHCTCEAFGCFCAPKLWLKPEPSPSPDGLGPKARALISESLSPPKPGLSHGFQAELGLHITKPEISSCMIKSLPSPH